MSIKIGDKVTRMLAGAIPMQLTVTNISEDFIYCGEWKFDRETGAEIDEVLGWTKTNSGSYIRL
jgi:predicted nucleotidyltransferase